MNEDFLRDFTDKNLVSRFGTGIILIIFMAVMIVMVNLKIGDNSLLEMVVEYYKSKTK